MKTAISTREHSQFYLASIVDSLIPTRERVESEEILRDWSEREPMAFSRWGAMMIRRAVMTLPAGDAFRDPTWKGHGWGTTTDICGESYDPEDLRYAAITTVTPDVSRVLSHVGQPWRQIALVLDSAVHPWEAFDTAIRAVMWRVRAAGPASTWELNLLPHFSRVVWANCHRPKVTARIERMLLDD